MCQVLLIKIMVGPITTKGSRRFLTEGFRTVDLDFHHLEWFKRTPRHDPVYRLVKKRLFIDTSEGRSWYWTRVVDGKEPLQVI